MKKVPILQFTLRADPESNANATTADLIILVLKQPPLPSQQNPTGGFDFAAIRARLRVTQALEKLKPSSKEIAFEDADYKTVVECVREYRGWRTTHGDIVQFCEQFGL